jgi:hypothetical protein
MGSFPLISPTCISQSCPFENNHSFLNLHVRNRTIQGHTIPFGKHGWPPRSRFGKCRWEDCNRDLGTRPVTDLERGCDYEKG